VIIFERGDRSIEQEEEEGAIRLLFQQGIGEKASERSEVCTVVCGFGVALCRLQLLQPASQNKKAYVSRCCNRVHSRPSAGPVRAKKAAAIQPCHLLPLISTPFFSMACGRHA
jgi:hypothetical protein